ncbi:MAG: hypothetical protein M1830_008332 [Pleopsidium flavum]|nr:MAG: hypothetical protein M1830_008332 [Pleopsidium flavum]
MSRGGRRGGRGGRGRGGGFFADLPFDPDLQIDTTPSALFPKYDPPLPKPLTRTERLQVAHYRTFRDRMHEGPLYSVLGDNVRVGKHGASAAAQFDPFEGMPTYSMKYKKKRRRLPKLDARPYVLKFFPEELWSVLDPEHATQNGFIDPTKKKKLLIPGKKRANVLAEFDRQISEDPDDKDRQRRKNALDKLPNDDEDDDDPEQVAEDDAPPEEEDADDDFEDDEDDMGGDYGEQYFDNGDDDRGEDEGGDDGGTI